MNTAGFRCPETYSYVSVVRKPYDGSTIRSDERGLLDLMDLMVR
jgi:hypothetical protein